MHLYDESNIDQIIRSKYVAEDFDEELNKQICDLLCDPQNMNIVIYSQKFEGQTESEAPWYKTKYSIAPFSEQLVGKLTNPNPKENSKPLGLPPHNKLIPKNFDILDKKEDHSKEPILLKQWGNDSELWYKKDDKFERPKAIVVTKFYSKDCNYGSDPEARVFTNLWQHV